MQSCYKVLIVADYRNAGLDFVEEKIVRIWLCFKAKSAVLRDITWSVKGIDLIAREVLIDAHLKMHWASVALKVRTNCPE